MIRSSKIQLVGNTLFRVFPSVYEFVNTLKISKTSSTKGGHMDKTWCDHHDVAELYQQPKSEDRKPDRTPHADAPGKIRSIQWTDSLIPAL